MSYNRITMVGNLTRDIELRYAQSGSAIASTAIATSHKFTSNGERKEEACFTDITFFGKSAEIANQYLRKGSKILVDGRLKLDQWTAQDGSKRSKHTIVVEKMVMLDSKHDAQAQAPQQQEQSPQGYGKHTDYQSHQALPQNQQQMPAQQQAIDIDEMEITF